MIEAAIQEDVQVVDPYEGLNDDQRKACSEICLWLTSSRKYHALVGPGGTGKTYLVQTALKTAIKEAKVVNQMMGKESPTYQIMYAATTNKAAEVLTDAVGQTARTIHSILALKPIKNYKTGKVDIKATPSSAVLSNTLLCIDEISMADSVLMKFIEKLTDDTCKILIMGDPAQLAPVGEDKSPAFSIPKKTSFLNQPMRNAEQPALMEMCNNLREAVLTGSPFKSFPHVPGVVDHVLDPIEARQLVSDVFLSPDLAPNARIVAYTNARVNQFNAFIRAQRNLPGALVKGEFAISNSALEVSRSSMLQVEEEVQISHVKPEFLKEVISIDGKNTDTLTYYKCSIKTRDAVEFTVKLPVDRDHFTSLLKRTARAKNWESHFHLKNDFADLRPRDACTVHKSQGSTYDTVFIDLTDIASVRHDREQLARLLYVAVSRARSRVIFIGALPQYLFHPA